MTISRTELGPPPWAKRSDPPPNDDAELPELPELTPSQIRGGWTPESLCDYFLEVEKRTSARIEDRRRQLRLRGSQTVTESEYDVFGR